MMDGYGNKPLIQRTLRLPNSSFLLGRNLDLDLLLVVGLRRVLPLGHHDDEGLGLGHELRGDLVEEAGVGDGETALERRRLFGRVVLAGDGEDAGVHVELDVEVGEGELGEGGLSGIEIEGTR